MGVILSFERHGYLRELGYVRKGYVRIWLPPGHPYAQAGVRKGRRTPRYGGWQYLHRYLVMKRLGRVLSRHEHAHHKFPGENEKRTRDAGRLEVKEEAAHASYHRGEWQRCGPHIKQCESCAGGRLPAPDFNWETGGYIQSNPCSECDGMGVVLEYCHRPKGHNGEESEVTKKRTMEVVQETPGPERREGFLEGDDDIFEDAPSHSIAETFEEKRADEPEPEPEIEAAKPGQAFAIRVLPPARSELVTLAAEMKLGLRELSDLVAELYGHPERGEEAGAALRKLLKGQLLPLVIERKRKALQAEIAEMEAAMVGEV